MPTGGLEVLRVRAHAARAFRLRSQPASAGFVGLARCFSTEWLTHKTGTRKPTTPLDPAICVQPAEEVVAIIRKDYRGEAEEQDHGAPRAAPAAQAARV